MTVSSRLVVGVLALSTLAITLTGCTADETEPESSTTATAEAADDSGLSFAQGNELSNDVDAAPVFLNGFADADSGWTEQDGTNADEGIWYYATDDGTCSVNLAQVVADDDSFELVAGDDRTSSVNVLSWFYRDNEDLATQIADAATDATLPFGTDWALDEPGTDFMGVSAQTDAGAFATYARAFGVPKVALVVELTCDTSEAFDTHSEDALMASAVITS